MSTFKSVLTFIVVFGAIAWLSWQALKYDIKNKPSLRKRKRVRAVIRSESDRSIVGDGAWINPPSKSSNRSALIRDMEEPRGV